MEPTANPAQMIQYIPQPVFLVKNGIITETNDAALNCQIKTGIPVCELITLGIEEYEAFSAGKLYLELKMGRAWVSICDDFHLFHIENSYSSSELRAFALAAQHLRMPLSNALSGTELLIQNEALHSDTALKAQLGQINQSLYQLMRAVCNMSDISQLGTTYSTKAEFINATSVFREIFEKAAMLTAETGHTLKFSNWEQDIECVMDAQLLERAVLNLVSNAIKFSPNGSKILAALKHNKNRLTLTVENDILDGQGGIYGNAFSRFLREPGIESGKLGIGLGMSVVSSAVSAHSGIVLLNQVRKNSVRISISLPVRTDLSPIMKSPVMLMGGYTGGIDSYLLELSDVLPSHFYESL